VLKVQSLCSQFPLSPGDQFEYVMTNSFESWDTGCTWRAANLTKVSSAFDGILKSCGYAGFDSPSFVCQAVLRPEGCSSDARLWFAHPPDRNEREAEGTLGVNWWAGCASAHCPGYEDDHYVIRTERIGMGWDPSGGMADDKP
jgi:hypothetical protein